MKKFSFLLFALLNVWVMQSCNQPAKPAHTEEEMIAAAKALDAKFFNAMNSENLDSVMSCYWNSPDLVVYPPGETEVKGWDALQKSFAGFFANMNGAKHELTETNYKVAGDVVICWGRLKMSVPGPDSTAAPMVMEGRYMDEVANKDGRWVFVVDHASVALPKPAPPAAEPVAEKKKM
jgi:ketosteroid isomerase-like protein